jgi:CheY-like chemotaxis protein
LTSCFKRSWDLGLSDVAEEEDTERELHSPRTIGLVLMAPPPTDRSAAHGAPGQPVSTRRVLVVDDSVDAGTPLTMMLADMGYDSRFASTEKECLEIAAVWHPDVVLLDVFMPQMTGFQLARVLREKYSPSTMRLVMMSGAVLDEETLLDAGNAGFNSCIGKPVIKLELDRIIADELSRLGHRSHSSG